MRRAERDPVFVGLIVVGASLTGILIALERGTQTGVAVGLAVLLALLLAPAAARVGVWAARRMVLCLTLRSRR